MEGVEIYMEGGDMVVAGADGVMVAAAAGEVVDGVTIIMEIGVIMGVLIIRGMGIRPTTLTVFIPTLIP